MNNTERARGLGRKKRERKKREKKKREKEKRKEKKREEIGKGNQMTARRFQTGGRHQTFPASLRWRVGGNEKDVGGREGRKGGERKGGRKVWSEGERGWEGDGKSEGGRWEGRRGEERERDRTGRERAKEKRERERHGTLPREAKFKGS